MAFELLHLPAGAIGAGTLDQSITFSVVRMPCSWQRRRMGPSIHADELGPRWVRDSWPPDCMLRPAYCRSAIGSTYAAFLLRSFSFVVFRNAMQANLK